MKNNPLQHERLIPTLETFNEISDRGAGDESQVLVCGVCVCKLLQVPSVFVCVAKLTSQLPHTHPLRIVLAGILLLGKEKPKRPGERTLFQSSPQKIPLKLWLPSLRRPVG